MVESVEKSWTILIYANGNNDLEPEMRQALQKTKKAGSSDDVNVVIEIGRAEYSLVQILRQAGFDKNDENWSGVRRYYIGLGESILLDNLKTINMADPMRLYEFIKWGLEAYPAKHCMLILGGHGYQFVGAMTDYSQGAPYIMGFPEMVRAINKAGSDAGRKIDLLVLDICYCNFIEMIYELGEDENHSVQHAITYILNGSIEGLPYDEIIRIMRENGHRRDMDSIKKQLIDQLPYDLVAFEINHLKLNYIKQMFNELALDYCFGKNGDHRLSQDLNGDFLDKAVESMFLVVTGFKKISKSDLTVINVANKPNRDLTQIARYYRLGFAKNNYWTYYLSNQSFDMDTVDSKYELHPLELTSREVFSYISIMNPGLNVEGKQEMLEALYGYKGWSKDAGI